MFGILRTHDTVTFHISPKFLNATLFIVLQLTMMAKAVESTRSQVEEHFKQQIPKAPDIELSNKNVIDCC
jgi:hypothetical protein